MSHKWKEGCIFEHYRKNLLSWRMLNIPALTERITRKNNTHVLCKYVRDVEIGHFSYVFFGIHLRSSNYYRATDINYLKANMCSQIWCFRRRKGEREREREMKFGRIYRSWNWTCSFYEFAGKGTGSSWNDGSKMVKEIVREMSW